MTTMSQSSFVFDKHVKPIAVIVPYDEWLEGQRLGAHPESGVDQPFVAGNLKHTLSWPDDPVDFQRLARAEQGT